MCNSSYDIWGRNRTTQLEQKLITAQRAMERRILNITTRDKIRNTKIKKQTQVKDVMVKIKEAKWRWAGHQMRRDGNMWTRRVTEWQEMTKELEEDRNVGGVMT